MQFVIKCILFPVFIMLGVIFMLVFHFAFAENLRPQIDNAINVSDKGTPQGNAFKPHQLLAGYETAGWIILGVAAFILILDLVLSSQKDEYEPYEYPEERRW